MSYGRKKKKLLRECDIDMNAHRLYSSLFAFGFGFAAAYLLFTAPPAPVDYAAAAAITVVFNVVPYLALSWIANRRGRTVEEVLPDFLSLVSGNIKSGLTLDRALVLSSKKEFGPLAREVDRATKKSVGAGLPPVLRGMSERIRSKTFEKTTSLIAEGVRSGGDLGRLLEKTSSDLRRFQTVKKEIEASISLYLIFIVAASALGAPFLYALATHLAGTMQALKPAESTPAFSGFGSGGEEVDLALLEWFAVAAITVTCFFGSMTMGLIRSAKRVEGLKYFAPMLLVAFAVFYGAKIALSSLLPVVS